jgi:hypothetical protein
VTWRRCWGGPLTLLALAAAVVLSLGPARALGAAAGPSASDRELSFVCHQLRLATVPLGAAASPQDQLAALRLLLDQGLQNAVGSLRVTTQQGTAPAGALAILHRLRVWRGQLQAVLRAVGAGQDVQGALDAAGPALAGSVAALAPLLPDLDGAPCALSAQGGPPLSAPARAALTYEGVLAALADRSSPGRLRSAAPAAGAGRGAGTRRVARLRASFPGLAASVRALLPDLSRAVRAAAAGRGGEVAAAVRRLGGIQPFLLGALATRDLGPVPVPTPAPAAGAPSVSVPPTRGLSADRALAALCRAGLLPAPHAVVVGELSFGRQRAFRRALAAARTPASRTRVFGRYLPVRVLGTEPAAGSSAAPGASVVLRLGVLQGTSVAFPSRCP